MDLTQVNALKFAIEWEETAVDSALYLDNIRFLPPASQYPDQTPETRVFLPLVSKDYRPPTLDPIWDFESGPEGWTHQTYTDSQAIIAVQSSSFRARWASTSLALILDLVGNDVNKGQGEAFIDLENTPPPGSSVPLDLFCKPVSCWVYVPAGGAGNQSAPNEVQIWVKDQNHNTEYGAPVQAVRDRWFKVMLRPSTVAPEGGWMAPGFDPSRIRYIGVRFRAGSGDVRYRGKIYIDACGWQEIDP